VLYVNGLAIALCMELKRSSVEVADGMRQLITNQEPLFNEGLLQRQRSYCWPGSDSQGLRYGTDRHTGAVLRRSGSRTSRQRPYRSALACCSMPRWCSCASRTRLLDLDAALRDLRCRTARRCRGSTSIFGVKAAQHRMARNAKAA
jgi:hypothetical protein